MYLADNACHRPYVKINEMKFVSNPYVNLGGLKACREVAVPSILILCSWRQVAPADVSSLLESKLDCTAACKPLGEGCRLYKDVSWKTQEA